MHHNSPAIFRDSAINELDSWLALMKLKNYLVSHQHLYVATVKVLVRYDEVLKFLREFVEDRISESINCIENITCYESGSYSVLIKIEFQDQHGNARVLHSDFDGSAEERDHSRALSIMLTTWVRFKFNNKCLECYLTSFFDTLKEFKRSKKDQVELSVKHVLFDRRIREPYDK